MTTVVLTRGGLRESVHTVIWCATDPDGAVTGAAANVAPDLPVFPRSATKPLQALPACEAGVVERLGLSGRHLALACASHGGTPEHIAIVAEILAAAGLTEDALQCGPLEPRDPDAAARMRAAGEPLTPIVHNCSGKHALGLALCVVRGWPTDDYLAPEHPLQQAMRASVAAAAGLRDVPAGVDGCGMPAFALPLKALARAFGALAAGHGAVAQAMREHPVLVAFAGAIDTSLMEAEPGVVAKVGAEGVLAVGTADGRGLALKVLDGGMRAIDPAGVALVRSELGLAAESAALDALARPAIVISRGVTVGEAEALL